MRACNVFHERIGTTEKAEKHSYHYNSSHVFFLQAFNLIFNQAYDNNKEQNFSEAVNKPLKKYRNIVYLKFLNIPGWYEVTSIFDNLIILSLQL